MTSDSLRRSGSRWSWVALILLAAGLIGCGGGSSSPSGSSASSPSLSSPHSVSLSWNPSTSSNIVGYNVYRGNQPGSYGLIKSMDSNTSYTDTTVEGGKTYYYVVTAVDSAGVESPYSNQAQALVP